LEDHLVRRLAAGDAAAYRQAYDRYGAMLFRTALRMLGSEHDAEDAVQELFTSMVRSRDRLAEVADLKAYLFVSLRHVMARMYRRRQRQAMTGLDEAKWPTAPAGEPARDAERLWKLARRLPADQQEVLALKIQGDLTFKEIGAVCGISPNTAASRYRYALEKLEQMLRTRQ
jgi:RNA polymerase sigma-70 factor (ECF subfamily)